MNACLAAALLGTSLLVAPALSVAQPAATAPASTAQTLPDFAQGSMNVFRRFAPEYTTKMVDFYQKVLGLEPLRPINLSASQQILLFRVGKTGQLKLAAGLQKNRQYQGGEPTDATGIRTYTLFFPDEAALAARFRLAGLPVPTFKAIGEGRRGALVKDPAGFTLELIVAPHEPAVYDTLEVGINVSDLDKSIAFYRDFAGLAPRPVVEDELVGVTAHPFRHGDTTINLWSVGKNLPADTGSAGIQYVIRNIDAVNATAKARHIAVQTPLGGVPGFNVRTVWFDDPDGATNYFYQMTPAPKQTTTK
jgi:catechol 2,3-dioxygenase-like lactoylglutathione lyase family enzyme